MAGEGDRVGHTLITSSQQVLLSLFLSGPNRGHYITIVKSHGYWLLFDDDVVEVNHCGNPISTWSSTTARDHVPLQEVEPHTIEGFFGQTDAQPPLPNESGYILFYQSRE